MMHCSIDPIRKRSSNQYFICDKTFSVKSLWLNSSFLQIVTYLCLSKVVYTESTRLMMDYLRSIDFPCSRQLLFLIKTE